MEQMQQQQQNALAMQAMSAQMAATAEQPMVPPEMVPA
jgi:hypothetical protein